MSDQASPGQSRSVRLLLQGMEFSRAYLGDPDGAIPTSPVLLLRMLGPDEEGKMLDVTVGVGDGDIDQFLGSVQEAVRDYKGMGL